jgi:hypothetical protein
MLGLTHSFMSCRPAHTCTMAVQGDEALLGGVDSVEAGEVWGWACLRGAPAKALQVDGLSHAAAMLSLNCTILIAKNCPQP